MAKMQAQSLGSRIKIPVEYTTFLRFFIFFLNISRGSKEKVVSCERGTFEQSRKAILKPEIRCNYLEGRSRPLPISLSTSFSLHKNLQMIPLA